MTAFDKAIADYITAAEELAAAQVEEATEFLRAKLSDERMTDGRAERLATVNTKSDVVVATARYQAAKLRAERAAHGVVETPEERLN